MQTANISELTQGYRLEADGRFRCLYCGQSFLEGEIFHAEGRFLDARRAMERHIAQAHGSAFEALLQQGKRQTGLTDGQRELMRAFYGKAPDKDIAAQLGISASTVRYQRHALREKARQAKAFLALMELMETRMGDEGERIPIHPGATMVDDRYMITQAEAQKILTASFSSMHPLKLRVFPPKQKKKLVILRTIAERFQYGKRYSGQEVDTILSSIFDDYVTLRRYLIEYGFMDRTADGREYWRIGQEEESK